MKKARLLVYLILILQAGLQTRGQVLFTFGSNRVMKDEFIRAFSKNNEGNRSEAAYREYLELYIRFRLKVKAAYDAGLDTLPAQKAEYEVFKSQVAQSYLHDEAILNNLVSQAIERSAKDIHVAHIFVKSDSMGMNAPGLPDTLKSFKLAREAYNALQKGASFEETAVRYSSDKAVTYNKGDLGFITVFTLPYALENLVYTTPVGQFTAPFRSKSGYHIFKVLGERKAAGKMRAAQILFVFPPGADPQTRSAIFKQADSVYSILMNGGSFSIMAAQFSGDSKTGLANGEMPVFGVGEYEPAFENAVFTLKEDGAITRPILSSFGYHIVKRLAHIPVEAPVLTDSSEYVFKQLVMEDARMEVASKSIKQNIGKLTGFRKAPVDMSQLMAYTDSVVRTGKSPKVSGLTGKTLLFSFLKEKVDVFDWITYLQANKPGQYINNSSFAGLFKQFQETVTTDYYLRNLDAYNPRFAAQLKEFRDGNLLFEVMQRNIWDKSIADSTGLKKYYGNNKSRYNWQPGADALLFNCTDSVTAVELKATLANSIHQWKSQVLNYGDKVQADSGRFEAEQLTSSEKDVLTPGMFTIPQRSQVNPGNISFAYIVNVYPKSAPRKFEDAKGFVINDYQAALEENWIKELKAKYPVTIYFEVLKSLWE